MNSEQDPRIAVVRRYLVGDLNLEAAAAQIQDLSAGQLGISFGYDSLSPEEAERMEALFGRLFWVAMKEANPNAVPPGPFGAKEFRMLQDRVRQDGADE